MYKTMTSKLADSIVSNHYSSRFAITGNPTEYADFCLNKCPHADEECNGSCAEFRAFSKGYFKTHKEERNRNAL